jgi:serine/threonine protein kinase
MSTSAPQKLVSSSKPSGSGATPGSPGAAGGATVDLTGRQLGDYLLLRRLGQGGMAEVYLAEQISLCRRIAFKVLRSNLALDANYIRRFRVEAQTVASLVHPNIVQVYDVGVLEGVHYIAQEYVLGKNLKQVMQVEKSLPLRTVVSIMRQVASALERAARSNIVHRDIKPENILLTSGGEVKVADFGLARSEKSSSLELTQDNTALGTPLYMSPEQIEARGIDARSDIYSYGVTFYQLLAGRPPFEGDSPIQVAWKHVNTPPAPLEEAALLPNLPKQLIDIIHKALAKKPEERFQSPVEILRDLREVPLPAEQEEWSTDLEASLAVENATTSAQQDDATQELSRLLKVIQPNSANTRLAPAAILTLAAVATFGIGGFLAWLGKPDLTIAERPRETQQARPTTTEIVKQPTVQDQYFYAILLNTQESLRSIAEYFPPDQSIENRYYSLVAEQRLAEYYLERLDPERAMECFKKLIRANGASDRAFQAYGYAGLAHVASLHSTDDMEENCLKELQQLIPLLTDEEWQEAYGMLSERQKRVMGPLRAAPGRPTSQED